MSRLSDVLNGPERVQASAHFGRRDHYRLARDLVARRPVRALLMQRSSTLLLGPEDGWHHEAEFHDEVWRSVAEGTEWYHIASLEGIERHLRRRSSTFASAGSRPEHLVDFDGVVAIRSAGRHPPSPIRILPEEEWAGFGDDFKVDRQARLVAAELRNDAEALIVSDVGDHQLTIQLRGTAARTVLDAGLAFYRRCPPLASEALAACMSRALTTEEVTR
jgi:hypothetical protein